MKSIIVCFNSLYSDLEQFSLFFYVLQSRTFTLVLPPLHYWPCPVEPSKTTVLATEMLPTFAFLPVELLFYFKRKEFEFGNMSNFYLQRNPVILLAACFPLEVPFITPGQVYIGLSLKSHLKLHLFLNPCSTALTKPRHM